MCSKKKERWKSKRGREAEPGMPRRTLRIEMRYMCLACDYDGTIAWDSVVAQCTVQTLERVKHAGRKPVLVKGRGWTTYWASLKNQISALRSAGEMDSDEKAVGTRVVELLTLTFVRFVARLPHTEAIVGLSIPVANVLQDDFLAGIVALDSIEYNFSLAVGAPRGRDTGLGVNIPREGCSICLEPSPFEWIKLGNNIVKSSFLRGGNAGIICDDGPRVLPGAPVRAEIA